MKVSLLCPSRQRSTMLKESVDSLGEGDWELLVAVDEDDPEFDQYCVPKIAGVKICPSIHHGYQNLHEYFNELARHAKGDWIGLWNDDTLMETSGWVDIIAQYDHTIPQVLNVWNERDNLFPLISRAWYEATGHFALNAHADSWVQQVAEIDGRWQYVPGIKIKHYGEELNDPTHTRVREIVRQTSEAYRRMGEQRMEDARKIADYIRRKDAANNQV